MFHCCMPIPPHNRYGCGFVSMMAQMNFFMGLSALTSMFTPFGIFGGLFNNWSMPFLNNSMFNLYAYNPVSMPSFGNSIFSTPPSYYTPNQPVSGGSDRFEYNPNAGFGTNYTPYTPVVSDNPFNPNISVPPNVSTPDVTNPNEVPIVDDGVIHTDGEVLDRRGNGYGKPFLDKVKQIARRINCNYRDLLAVMNGESGIRSDIQNPNGSATGLIQFTANTARGLGTSVEALKNMTPLEQLDYVEKYIMRAKNRAGMNGRLSAGDLYALVFLPARANREVLTVAGESYYEHNKATDINGDGKITKTELAQRVKKKYVSDESFLG